MKLSGAGCVLGPKWKITENRKMIASAQSIARYGRNQRVILNCHQYKKTMGPEKWNINQLKNGNIHIILYKKNLRCDDCVLHARIIVKNYYKLKSKAPAACSCSVWWSVNLRILTTWYEYILLLDHDYYCTCSHSQYLDCNSWGNLCFFSFSLSLVGILSAIFLLTASV